MNNYWDDIPTKSWDDAYHNQEILDLLKIDPKKLHNQPKPIINVPPKTKKKHEGYKRLDWKFITSIDELDSIQPLPQERRHHKIIIPNGRVLFEFKKAIRRKKMYIRSEKGYLSSNGIYFYLAELNWQAYNSRENKDYKYCLGFMNHNNKDIYGCRMLRGETITTELSKSPLEMYFRRGFNKHLSLYHTKNVINTMQNKFNETVHKYTTYNKQRSLEITKQKHKIVTDFMFGYFIVNFMYHLKGWGVTSQSAITKLIILWGSDIYPKTAWGLEQAFISEMQQLRNPSDKIILYNTFYDIITHIISTPKYKLKRL